MRISDTNGTPHNSAGLEIDYNNRGLLVPRMTQAQRDAIGSPAHSLLIFNLTTNCYEWWDNVGSRWVTISCGDCSSAPSDPTATAGTNVTGNSFTANWKPVGTATYYRLEVATDMAFTNPLPGFNNLNVGNVTSFDVPGFNCCVTLNCNTTYYYRVKACNPCGCSNVSNVISVTTSSTVPSAPTANAATGISSTDFTANWSSSTGATSYRLDVATDAAFTNMVTGYNDLNVGNVTSYNVTGLACNTTYYYRVRACNSCGCSGNSNTINLTTNACAETNACQIFGLGNEDSIYCAIIDGANFVMAGSTIAQEQD